MKRSMHHAARPLLLAIVLCTWLSPAVALPERPLDSTAELLQRLHDNTAGALLNRQLADQSYRAIQATGNAPLFIDGAGSDPEIRARSFLSLYGALFGISDALRELTTARISRDGAGNTHVHLDQQHDGLPVFGARLVVHMNDGGIIGTSGVFVDGLPGLPTRAKLGTTALRERALAAARKLHPQTPDLAIGATRLMIYRSGLLKGIAGSNHLAYEAMVGNGSDIRERIILDANSGAVLNRINEIHGVLNREIYTPNADVPPLLTEGGALSPEDPPFAGDVTGSTRKGDLPQNNLYIFAGGTYALYKNLFGREGYDDGDTPPEEQVQRSVYLVNEQCPNAYWNGTSTNYCPGFDADDVVSHEWSHAYTQFTHGLVYQYQSGALNESYSDIFGEMYDLVNGIEGPLGVTLTEGEYFENGGSRWVVGEDLSEIAAGLLLRDMWDPDNFTVNVPILGLPITSFAPSPGSVITSGNYFCGTGDGGGVHTNSGVPNHAFAMLVDGKEFNGLTIPKIGLIKAAHIYFHAQTNYQTPTTNFAQHADALEQSCADLIGAPLNDVFGAVSSEVISAADCDAVHIATEAVEFRQSPKEKCGYVPVLLPEAETPALCPEGQAPEPSFSETWEGAAIPSDWTLGQNLTGDTEPEVFAFEVKTGLPAPHGGHAAFAVDDTGGTCTPGGDISGAFWMDSPAITVAEAASFLTFTHFMQSEADVDGGILRYSIGDGAFAAVPADAYTHNAYNSTLRGPPPLDQNSNPQAGEMAWSGSDQGEATGSWGRTVVDLGKLGITDGDSVRFRWEFGQDGCGGNLGWYIDDTAVFSCKVGGSGLPEPTPVGGTTGGTTGGSTGGTTGGGDGDAGRFGASALGWLLLMPLFGMAALRRRAQN
jgi:bacillolysin